MMKALAVLFMALSCSLSEAQQTVDHSSALRLTELEGKLALLEEKLLQSEKEILELRSHSSIGGVAFTAALRVSGDGPLGPYEVDHTLSFRNLITNVGNGYNTSTGLFTAPVKGMYYFQLTAMSTSPPNTLVTITKNEKRLSSIWLHDNKYSSGSNGVAVALEVGDLVYVKLPATRSVHDNEYHYSTFSGFLLFPMSAMT